MGFGDLIKKIFSKEPEAFEEIKISEMDKWLNEKIVSRRDFLNGQLSAIKEKASGESKLARQNIEALRTAQLRNPNIPEKAKHFMQGNRDSYIKWTEQFIEKLEIPESAEDVKEFLERFKNSLEEFSKLTLRPYKILTEFFEEEASRVALNIKNIDSLAGEIRQDFKDSNLKELDEVGESVKNLKGRIMKKTFLGEEIRKMDERAEMLKKDKQKLEKNISEIKESKEYRDCTAANQKLEETRKLSAEKEAEIASLFSSLERPMKKYHRVVFNDKDLLEKYIESPIRALTQDFGFKIVSILSNMRKAIEDNSLELKDKQKQKALYDIGWINKDFLGKFVSEYAQIKKKENDLAKEIKSSNILARLKEAREKLEVASSMLEKAQSNLERLGGEIGKIDIEAVKKELEEKIREKLKINAVIS